MKTITMGEVKDGVIVPNIPLPERAWVRIELIGVPPEMPPGLQEELDGWNRARAQALELVERMAQEMDHDEKR
jgi:hypothetical protein